MTKAEQVIARMNDLESAEAVVGRALDELDTAKGYCMDVVRRYVDGIGKLLSGISPEVRAIVFKALAPYVDPYFYNAVTDSSDVMARMKLEGFCVEDRTVTLWLVKNGDEYEFKNHPLCLLVEPELAVSMFYDTIQAAREAVSGQIVLERKQQDEHDYQLYLQLLKRFGHI